MAQFVLMSSPRSFLVCLCYFCSPKLQSQRPSKRISSAFRGQTTPTEEEGLESLGVASKHWQKPAWTDMKGPNGVEWYNVIIIILAVIGVFVNTCSLVVLIKKRKNSMFYKLLKVNTMYPNKFWTHFTNNIKIWRYAKKFVKLCWHSNGLVKLSS